MRKYAILSRFTFRITTMTQKQFSSYMSRRKIRIMFVCHRCDSKCKATEYRIFTHFGGKNIYIATAYDCSTCGLRFITNLNLFDHGKGPRNF
jgi:DNA-directed RNA polymerase subunit RPC12/RpoP